MKKIVLLLVIAAAVASCGQSAKIKGHIASTNPADTVIVLEAVSPAGTAVVDSVVSKNGKFSFRVKLADEYGGIYNVKSKSYLVPLVVAPGERVVVKAAGNVLHNYTVEGSQGSEQLHELAMLLNNGALSLDSLTSIYTHLDPSDAKRGQVAAEYARRYFDIKRQQITFIVTNAGSLASMYGLYQRLPNDNTLFNGESDVVYYRLVADSLEAKAPQSPYLVSLRKDISRMEVGGMLSDMSSIRSISYPEIELPDMYGKKIALTSLAGKVIVLDFWTAGLQQCRLQNAEYKEMYNDLHESGLEIYQVSLDTDKALWVNLVQQQKLPWITVCDFMGQGTYPVRAYNVQAIPANFVIDREGNIVSKNLYGKKLEAKIKELL